MKALPTMVHLQVSKHGSGSEDTWGGSGWESQALPVPLCIPGGDALVSATGRGTSLKEDTQVLLKGPQRSPGKPEKKQNQPGPEQVWTQLPHLYNGAPQRMVIPKALILTRHNWPWTTLPGWHTVPPCSPAFIPDSSQIPLPPPESYLPQLCVTPSLPLPPSPHWRKHSCDYGSSKSFTACFK